jgi:hypothetical protein
MCGLIRRYGASEPAVAHALLRLLSSCAPVAAADPERCAAIGERARIVVSDAEREAGQPADLALTHADAESLLQIVARHRPRSHPPGGAPDEPRTLRRQGDTANTGTQPAVMARPAARQRTSGSGQCYGRFMLKPAPGAKPSLQRAPTRSALPWRWRASAPRPAAARWVTGLRLAAARSQDGMVCGLTKM